MNPEDVADGEKIPDFVSREPVVVGNDWKIEQIRKLDHVHLVDGFCLKNRFGRRCAILPQDGEFTDEISEKVDWAANHEFEIAAPGTMFSGLVIWDSEKTCSAYGDGIHRLKKSYAVSQEQNSFICECKNYRIIR
jgi:hypothetical protein